MKLSPAGAEAVDGQIVVRLADDHGGFHHLPLSVFDVSTMVSLLYETRASALKQERDEAPEVMLPLTDMPILRLTVAPGLHHDYAAPHGTPIASVLDAMADALANEDKSFGPEGLQN